MRGKPEWDWFAGDPPATPQWETVFMAHTNAREATLFLRQDDVKQEWPVELNGRRLGKLFLMEADLIHTLRVPPGVLHEGTNRLAVVPPRDVDDVVLREVTLDPRPLDEALNEATLAVELNDAASGTPLPGRLTVVDPRGALAPMAVLSNAPPVALRPGVVYTGSGSVRVGLPAGSYTVYASRGFEWSVATQSVRVAVGEVALLNLSLTHQVATPGWVSCDTHVHTFTHSGHGDATIDERMLTLAGEGLELPIATDHNIHVDYRGPAQRMNVTRWFTPVMGNEVTTPAGHFNIFPVLPESRPPDYQTTNWPALMRSLRATPGVQVVVLNHPRNIHAGFQPFAATNFDSATGDNRRGPEFSFDAIELLNSSAQQTDYLLVLRDWFALLNHGYRITGVGSSDGHDVSRYIIGQGRTYIRCRDTDAGRIPVGEACSNLVAGHALVSMGLLATVSVNERSGPGDLATGLPAELAVTVRVFGPSWVVATNVALFANGVLVRSTALNPAEHRTRPSAAGEQGEVTWRFPRPAHDVFLVAVAAGPGMQAPFWAIPRPYQPVSPHWESRVLAVTNPVWVDADGDGRFTPARTYAQRVVEQAGVEPAKLLPALANFDEAVAAQAAGWCAGRGADIASPEFARYLAGAGVAVQRGFSAFLLARP
jgi:hypothetical protein